MNNKKRVIAAGAVFMMLCLAACGNTNAENPYGSVVRELDDDTAYALLDMDYEEYVMVTSDELYDTGTEQQGSTVCNVYYYKGEKVKDCGTIRSRGTEYPVTFGNDGIFVASENSVEKYAISERGELYLEKGVYEGFDISGNAMYTSASKEIEIESSKDEYQDLRKEYEESQIIHFAYGANDCVNKKM